MDKQPLLNLRYTARFLVEAATPLKVGTGEPGVNVDELICTDANGLPMIPGTALAGVLRHSLDKTLGDTLFGFQEKKKGMGSRVILSEARMVGKDGNVKDGLIPIDFTSSFYSKFKNLPIRDHVRITHRGVADSQNSGKFDDQIVFKGCRFVFDLELKGVPDDGENWKLLLNKLQSPEFRIGGGTRKGFGELKVLALEEETYVLENNWNDYAERSSSLSLHGLSTTANQHSATNITAYRLELLPDDFFGFTAGYGDTEVDSVVKKEIIITWENETPEFAEEKILIPATSVKGAISHRVAFYYNQLVKNFADGEANLEALTGENNPAVQILFGSAKNSKTKKPGQRGRVILSDVYLEEVSEKIFNHVKIDQFTGGAIDSALFDEKVVHTKEQIVLNLYVENKAFEPLHVQEALEKALKDITTGMLPLGGHVMRGHGCFQGTVKRNGEVLA